MCVPVRQVKKVTQRSEGDQLCHMLLSQVKRQKIKYLIGHIVFLCYLHQRCGEVTGSKIQ